MNPVASRGTVHRLVERSLAPARNVTAPLRSPWSIATPFHLAGCTGIFDLIEDVKGTLPTRRRDPESGLDQLLLVRTPEQAHAART